MDLGADGVLMNTAIALAGDAVAMATAMKLAVQAWTPRVPCRSDPEAGARIRQQPLAHYQSFRVTVTSLTGSSA
jgi:thiazole synthase ThiGH ThiG subunit